MRRAPLALVAVVGLLGLPGCAMLELMAPPERGPNPAELAPAPMDQPGTEVEGLVIQWPDGVDERRNFLVTSLHRRAQDPSLLSDLDELSLDPDGIELLLGNAGSARTAMIEDLHEPAAWDLDAPEGYAGFTGPFSALRSLGRVDELTVRVGDHPFCANPGHPAPGHLADLTRISIEPTQVESCIDWFTVELYLDPDGIVQAILLDLFGP